MMTNIQGRILDRLAIGDRVGNSSDPKKYMQHVEACHELLQDCAAELARLTKELETRTADLAHAIASEHEQRTRAEANAKDAERLEKLDATGSVQFDVAYEHGWRTTGPWGIGTLREAIDNAMRQQPATPEARG